MYIVKFEKQGVCKGRWYVSFCVRRKYIDKCTYPNTYIQASSDYVIHL